MLLLPRSSGVSMGGVHSCNVFFPVKRCTESEIHGYSNTYIHVEGRVQVTYRFWTRRCLEENSRKPLTEGVSIGGSPPADDERQKNLDEVINTTLFFCIDYHRTHNIILGRRRQAAAAVSPR